MARYVCKYANIASPGSNKAEMNCGCDRATECPLHRVGDFREDCISTKQFVYGTIYSTTLEEHEKRFHNLKKDC